MQAPRSQKYDTETLHRSAVKGIRHRNAIDGIEGKKTKKTSSWVREACPRQVGWPTKMNAMRTRAGGTHVLLAFVLWPLATHPFRHGATRRGGCTHVMHGGNRMTMDPRIPTMPGRSKSGFDRSGRHCLNQARSAAVRCWASRMKGELHPKRIADFLAYA